jgi:molecular chaperone DnaJ
LKEAAEAYEILNDPDRRATYDRYGHEGLRSGGMGPDFSGFGSMSDLFEAFFGGMGFGGTGSARGGPRAGGDIAMTAEITLEQAAAGEELELTFEAIETCERCHGNGAEPGTPIETCERCGGAGMLQAVTRSPFGQIVRSVACDVCGGEGKVAKEPCTQCDGRGREVRRRTLRVDVPAGIADGQRIRLGGRGHAGEAGGPPGDLYVLIHVREHERFMRQGDELVTVVDVPAPRAALGTTVYVDGIDGEEIEIEIPAGTQPGDSINVRGAGMPSLSKRGRDGDLVAVVNVQIPRKLDREQRELLERLAESVRPDQFGESETLVGKLRRLLS